MSEKIILEGTINLHGDTKRKLLLTNKKLVIDNEEILLSSINDASMKFRGFCRPSQIVIKLKDGSKREFTPQWEENHWSPKGERNHEAMIDKWLTAINTLLIMEG